MGLIQVPRGIQTKRGYAPADIARSAAESMAPHIWQYVYRSEIAPGGVWSFQGGSGDIKNLVKGSPAGDLGLVSQHSWILGPLGRSVYNNSGDSLDVTSPDPGWWHDGITSHTVLCAVKMHTNQSPQLSMIYEFGGDANGLALGFRQANNEFIFATAQNSNIVEISSGGGYDPPITKVVAARFSAGEMTIIMDGRVVATGSNGSSIPSHGAGPGILGKEDDPDPSNATGGSADPDDISTSFLLAAHYPIPIDVLKDATLDPFVMLRRRPLLVPVSASGGNEVTDTAAITTSTATPTTSAETASATDTAQITAAIASVIQSADTGTATDTPTITSATASTLVAEVGQAVTDTALITSATATSSTATDTGSATDAATITTATATTLQATAQSIVTDAAAIVTATATPLTAQSGNTITDTPSITQVGTATLTANETATATDQAAPTSASVTVRTSSETASALDNATIVNASGQPIASIETSAATDNPDVTVATITPLTATILPEVLVTELYGETKIVPVLQGTFSVDALLSGTLQVKPH